MRISEHLKRYFASWTPGTYRRLTALSLREHITHLFAMFWIILAVMILVGIPQLVTLSDRIATGMETFETFSLDAEVNMSGHLEVTASPLIVIDLEKENLSKERLLVNNNGVYSNGWFRDKAYSWDDLREVNTYAAQYSSWLALLAIILIPSLIVLLFLFAAVEVVALLLLTVLLGLAITRVAKFRVSVKQLVKVGLVASVPTLSVQLFPLFYIRWFIVPVVFYVLLVIFGVIMIGHKKGKKHKKHVASDNS